MSSVNFLKMFALFMLALGLYTTIFDSPTNKVGSEGWTLASSIFWAVGSICFFLATIVNLKGGAELVAIMDFAAGFASGFAFLKILRKHSAFKFLAR